MKGNETGDRCICFGRIRISRLREEPCRFYYSVESLRGAQWILGIGSFTGKRYGMNGFTLMYYVASMVRLLTACHRLWANVN